MIKNKLLLLMANFLHGAMSAQDFSFTFPTELSEMYDDLEKQDPAFAQKMEDEMPELCASFDPYNTEDPDTISEDTFRKKVTEIYLDVMEHDVQKVS